MELMPIMEPPGGDCVDICKAADWQVKNEPERLVVRVLVRREGVILGGVSYGNGRGEDGIYI